MSCQQHCPISKASRQPQHRLDQVRRKLEFSEGPTESSGLRGPPPDKYGNFKKVSEAHSSHDIESPMYTSAQLASVPDSFLEYFARAPPKPPSPRKAPSPCYQSNEPCNADDIPESFLQYCEERIAARGPAVPQPPTPPQRSSRSMAACSPSCMEDVTPGTPYNTSYYGYDMYPGDPHRMLFEPMASSTPRPQTPRSSPQPQQGYYPPAPMPYYLNKAPSYQESQVAVRISSPLATSTPIGSGKYGQPTPPRAPVCTSRCAMTPESTVSSGDFSCSPSRRSPASSARSRSLEANQHSPGRSIMSSYKSYSYEENQGPARLPAPLATSTPIGSGHCGQPPPVCTPPCATLQSTVSSGDLANSPSRRSPASSSRSKSLGANQPSHARYMMSRKETSTTSLGRERHQLYTACSEDVLKSSNPCQRCPTLGVTPVHSGVSFSSSLGNMEDNRQSIREGIEHELIVREQQERSQLEADLSRWQQARRKLVINTASMGS